MKWYWQVRIYNKEGNYWHAEIITGRELREIDGIQDFYKVLTGCKMLLEGMSGTSRDIAPIDIAFAALWPAPAIPPTERVTSGLSDFQRKLDASVTPQQAREDVRRERQTQVNRNKPHPQPDGFINDYD